MVYFGNTIMKTDNEEVKQLLCGNRNSGKMNALNEYKFKWREINDSL